MLSALGITVFALDVTPQIIPDKLANVVTISSYSLSVVTTVLSTVIIVIQILMVSHMPGASHQPQIAMEIIVESAIPYSISALVYTSFLSSVPAFTATNAIYVLYADIFFAYMAVASHPSCHSVLVF